jgi:hypothetical protein
MLSRQRIFAVIGVASFASGALTFVNCAPDEDESVTLVTSCDLNALNTSDPAEATVKLYSQTGDEMTTRAKALVDRFTKICNDINRDLGQTEGRDVHEACNRIADRVIAANSLAPVPDGGVAPLWVTVNFDITCALDGKAVATCVDQCSAKKGCDPAATCPAGRARGQCAGKCDDCTVGGEGICNGACNGECEQPNVGPEAGIPACQGECRGTCKAGVWQGACSTGCNANFRGKCAGTCRGSCDGVPYPSPAPDGGPGDSGAPDADPDAGDAAVDAAVVDAGGGDAAAPPGSGVCSGICSGACVGEASGTCGAPTPGGASPCQGEFKGGLCTGACVGQCIGVAAPCVTKCVGTCTSTATGCTGTCSTCDGTLANAQCTSSPTCPEVNPICAATCALRAAMATTCPPSAVDIRVAGDYALPTALKNHAADFSAAAREATLLSSNLSGVLQRTPSEFREIGVVRDNARFCAAEAPKKYDEVRKLVNEAAGATLVVQGTKF